MNVTKRILSGTRPTGPLHIGNYLGAIESWVKNQSKNSFYMIADWHVLTTEYNAGLEIKKLTIEVALDLLASGIDPEKCTLFVQSQVKEHSELALLLSMVTPISWLERNPTFKEQLRELKGKDIHTHGFLGYPVLQASDILLYDTDLVPVGEDQLPHLELTREIARRFNHIFGKLFKEPDALLTKTPKLPGTDGRKMSKSYDNCIYLKDTPKEVGDKFRTMMTDPARKRRTDKGNPEVCPVFSYHKIMNAEGQNEIAEGCRSASIGCIDCKKILSDKFNEFMEPLWERRHQYQKQPKKVREILEDGNLKAKAVASKKITEVREKIKL